MTKDELMKLRSMLLYLADCLVAINDMWGSNNCNNCGIKNRCTYAPEVGTPVRWNCPLWQEDERHG